MKVDMSPEAIENRLKLVGELTKAGLLIRRNSLEKKPEIKKNQNDFLNRTDKKNGLEKERFGRAKLTK